MIDLTAANYQNLTDTTVTFNFYAGGSGTGDIDFDTVVIDGRVSAVTESIATTPEPAAAALGVLGIAGLMLRRRQR